MLILDVDGVLTDGRLYYGPRGEALKAFDVRDGHGIRAVQRAGIEVSVISGRRSQAVTARCRELGIRTLVQGSHDKLADFEALRKRRGLQAVDCAFMGDDEVDVGLMGQVGLAVAPADAHPSARRAAHQITRARGGRGAVREICDQLLARRPRRIRK
jgi:3-deoxy-D-manno-octulosonate 8-phosphate phosphatase (KDO 8-P phosphatase)